MKKLLVFSDTHGRTNACIDAILGAKDVSGIIHAGDCARDAEDLAAGFPDIPVYYVIGNNDFFSNAPASLNLEIGGKKIYVTHGHLYRVKNEVTLSMLKAAGRGSELVIFGHTHKPMLEYSGDMTILNPGSITYSKTYAEVIIDGGEMKAEIKEI